MNKERAGDAQADFKLELCTYTPLGFLPPHVSSFNPFHK